MRIDFFCFHCERTVREGAGASARERNALSARIYVDLGLDLCRHSRFSPFHFSAISRAFFTPRVRRLFFLLRVSLRSALCWLALAAGRRTRVEGSCTCSGANSPFCLFITDYAMFVHCRNYPAASAR